MKTKILIIDDEQMLLDNFKMIKWDEGVEVSFCNNAISAVDLIPCFDGIISDVMMANSDKLDAALGAVNENISVCRMTGNFDYAGSNVLIKPFSIKKLKEVVNDMRLNHQKQMSEINKAA